MAGAKDARRSRTQDRGPPGSRAVIHTVEQIGLKREMLPNGSMLCRDVPIARTGWMMYGPGETPVPIAQRPGATPVAYVSRDEDTLFAAECMGSFVGVAVTIGHPPVNVTPENWKTLAGGVVLEVRRGTGDDADCILADLLITDKYLIEQINSGKREVSCGYEADYFITGDGEGRQANIIGNHLALVERGRCGPRCAIGDHDPSEQEEPMTTKTQGASRARVPMLADAKRQRVADATRELADATAELEDVDASNDDRAVHVHVHLTGDKAGEADPKTGKEGEEGDDKGKTATTVDEATDKRIGALETGMTKIEGLLGEIAKKIGTGDAAGTPPKAGTGAAKDEGEEEEGTPAATADSAALERSFKDLVAEAEILSPGFKVPTFDSAAQRKATVDSMCKCRRAVLTAAHATTDGAALIEGITGSKTFDLEGMGCGDVAVLFKAAAGAKRLLNNRSATGDSGHRVPEQIGNLGPKPSMSAAEMNKRAAEFWSQHDKS